MRALQEAANRELDMQWVLLAQQTGSTTSWLSAGLLVSLLAVFAADRLLAYLRTRGIDLQLMHRRVEELHDWHNHDDPDQVGVKIWWNQKYLADIIRELATVQRSQMDVLQALSREVQDGNHIKQRQLALLEKLTRMHEDLEKLIKRTFGE